MRGSTGSIGGYSTIGVEGAGVTIASSSSSGWTTGGGVAQPASTTNAGTAAHPYRQALIGFPWW